MASSSNATSSTAKLIGGVKLVTYYTPATSLTSATGAVVTVILLTLIAFTGYVGYQVYYKQRTHFIEKEVEKEK